MKIMSRKLDIDDCKDEIIKRLNECKFKEIHRPFVHGGKVYRMIIRELGDEKNFKFYEGENHE